MKEIKFYLTYEAGGGLVFLCAGLLKTENLITGCDSHVCM